MAERDDQRLELVPALMDQLPQRLAERPGHALIGIQVEDPVAGRVRDRESRACQLSPAPDPDE